MTSKTHLVFVYGSLKTGFRNHNVLGRARHVCDAVTEEKYRMVSFGSFPAVVEDSDHEHARHVTGEVYMVSDSTLADMDQLESCPTMYDRFQIRLQGMDADVWMYFYQTDVGRLTHDPSVVMLTDMTVSWTHKIMAMPSKYSVEIQ